MSTTTAPVLRAEDRCDRCGAQAYVLVRLQSGGDLTFCVHHYSTHARALAVLTDEVIDESNRLLTADLTDR